MKFQPPQYWESIHEQVQAGRFLEPFASFWGTTSKEYDLIRRANALAELIHNGDVREGNSEPYVYHPQRAARMLTRVNMYGPRSTAAALLHDTYEDHPAECPLTLIREEFGLYTMQIVEALTKPSAIGLEAHPLVRSKLKAARVRAAGDVAVIVKGYERNDNLLTLYGDKRKRISQLDETERDILPLTQHEPVLYNDLVHSIHLQREYLEQVF